MGRSSAHNLKQTLFTSLILLAVVISALGTTRPARAEGSKELETNGGKRATTEWRTSLYGNLLPRRTLLKVYANAGEVINLGSSALGIGSGDIVVWTPGQITAPLTVALPTPAFNCSSVSTTNGRMTTRVQELAGPLPNSGGYTPCTYTAATTGIYNVAFYGPLGGSSDTYGADNSINAPVIDATQNSGVSMWDITVRDSTNTVTHNGRVFTDYLTQMAWSNGPTYRINSTLYAVTKDGFQYKIDMRGVDPNAFIIFGNTVGFLNSDNTPLYHDLVNSSTIDNAANNALNSPLGGVTLATANSLLFFNPPDPNLPASIMPTPLLPIINKLGFHDSLPDNLFGDNVPSIKLGTSGTFVLDGNTDGVVEIIIAPNTGDSKNPGSCNNVNFDPNLSTNRTLRVVVSKGVTNLTWDAKDNSGANMPTSSPLNGGPGYCYKANLHGGEYHFPLLDPENSMLGGPTITLLNPPGGTCPLATCSTAFFDDTGYTTTNGTTVGTVGSVLTGNNPPPAPYQALEAQGGYDTTSTTIRAYGNDGIDGFGDKKGLDLWTYYPSSNIFGRLYVVDVDPVWQLGLTKTDDLNPAPYDHVGQVVTYTLTATNTGTMPLTNVTVSDNPNLTGFSCTPAIPVPSLAPEASIVCTGTHSITQADMDALEFDDTASATSTEANAPDAPDKILGEPDPGLDLTKAVEETSFTKVGQTLHYTLVATNIGNVTLTNVTISDATLGTLTCTPAQPVSLAPGAALTCKGTYVITQGDLDETCKVDNTAYATGTYGATPIPAAPASSTVPGHCEPGLSLTKEVHERYFTKVGQTLHYTMVAKNTGNVTLSNVAITDAKLGALACTPGQPATLAPQEKLICTGSYITTQADFDLCRVDNTVIASGFWGATAVPAPDASAKVLCKHQKEPVPPETGFAPNRISKLPLQTVHYTALGDLWLEIPRLGVKTSIVGVPQTDTGWDVSWLGDQAGWLNGTAFPTWPGNSLLTAHVYDAFGRPGPFAQINGLVYGDRIIVHAWGGSYVYEVQQVIQVTPDAFSSVLIHEELPWVTLLTCRGYDEASHSYKYRVAVRAVLVEVK